MFKLSIMLGALVVLCLILPKSTLSAQNQECGTPDLSRPDYQDLLNSVGLIPAGSGSMSFNLPIWFNVVRRDTSNGVPGWDENFVPDQLIDGLNNYFSQTGIQFYFCGVTYISSDNWLDLTIGTESAALRNQAEIQNPINYENVINVFLCNTIDLGAGYTDYPWLVPYGAIYLAGPSSNILAHEMGHYFSLPHTFIGGPTIVVPSHPEYAQFVNDTVTLLVNGVSKTFTCKETGDMFCDTNADPDLLDDCTFVSDCGDLISCPNHPNDPLGIPFNPDPTLLMSYYDICRNRFSDKQIEQMREMLMSSANWSFLVDANEPNCQHLNSADQGFIQRNCNLVLMDNPIGPIRDVSVPFEDASSQVCGSIEAITNVNGRYLTFSCVYPYNGNGMLSILPDIDHSGSLEGVTTYDLVQISKHILSIEPFENPFMIIAADINNNAAITTFDIVELRKLILGIYTELPNNTSWRYIPEFCFNDSTFLSGFYDPGNWLNPFDAVWINPEEPTPPTPGSNLRTYGNGPLLSAPNTTSWMDHVTFDPNGLAAQEPESWSFWGIKIGDVNCTAVINAEPPEDPDRFFTTTPHTVLSTNQIFTLQVKAFGSIPVSSWQLGVDFAKDSLQILEIQPGNSIQAFTLDNFGLTHLSEGKFRALNFSENGTGTNLNSKTLFKIKMRALKPISNIGQHFRLKNSVLSEKFYSTSGEEIENIGLHLEVSTGLGMSAGFDAVQNGIGDEQFNLSVYPVPFSSEIMFDFYLLKDEKVHLSVFNSFGHLVVEKDEPLFYGTQSLKLINLAEQPAGFYWYSLETEDQLYFGKISKQ